MTRHLEAVSKLGTVPRTTECRYARRQRSFQWVHGSWHSFYTSFLFLSHLWIKLLEVEVAIWRWRGGQETVGH